MSAASYRLVKPDSDNDSLLESSFNEEAQKHTDHSAPDDDKISRYVLATLFLSLLLNASFLFAGFVLYRSAGAPSNPIFPQALYSPAQDVIQYETRTFHEGFGKDRSIYQEPPSLEVDAAWEDLYTFGVSRIPKSDAERLVNSTYRIPGDEDHYVIELDVFHQLHCLNMVRKALYPDYYPVMHSDPKDPNGAHWSHCIEGLRQSLMCSADISPIVWQWVERVKEVRIVGNIIHTCRDYDKIKQWALERQLLGGLDFTGFV